MEAEVGIEPTNDGFANHCLTTWRLRRYFPKREAIDYAACHNMSMPGFPENFRNTILPLAAALFPLILPRAKKD